MAKKMRDDASEPTEPKNFRLRTSVIVKVEGFRDRHPLRPTLTQIMEAALLEYVAAHADELRPEPAAPKRPKS